MAWKDKMKDFGGGDLAFLSEDGEVIVFIVVGDPVLLEGRFKGRPSQKIGCPIVTSNGFVLFIAGKRLARKISKYEEQFSSTAFMAIRHGEQNEITSTYELKIVDDALLTQELIDFAAGRDFKAEIQEAIASAESVMRQ